MRLRPLLAVLVLNMLLLGFPTPAGAIPLNLFLPTFPDVLLGGLTTRYDATADQLTVTGTALEFNDDGTPENIVAGSFSLVASIDDGGVLLGGAFTIGGSFPPLGFASGTLLTGNLTAFGFRDEGGDPLEFLFDATGGDAASLYPGGGLILSLTGFAGSFEQDFGRLGSVADVRAVPEPSAATLLALSLLGFAAGARRSHPDDG
jgi:hypothetical protein